MIREILEKINFKIGFDNDLDKAIYKAIIDNYRLKNGLYVKVGDNVEFYMYKFKKDAEKEMCLTNLEGNPASHMYKWFCERDYVSDCLGIRKVLDNPKKKIRNNNYLTLFCKAKEFNDKNKEHFVKVLYGNLKDFKNFKDKKEKEILENFKDYIFSKERQKDIESKKSRFLEIFEEIKNKKNLVKGDEYIKIFFDEPLEKYENEAKIYYALKIYNKIKFIYKISNKTYGLSDFNISFNSKKPFLAHKTRGFDIPFLVEKSEIFLHKKVFDFLKFVKDFKEPAIIKNNEGNHKSGIYVYKENSGDAAEIIDFDILPYKNEIVPEFVYRDYLSKEIKDDRINDFEVLFKKVDNIFFNNNLSLNLYGNIKTKISDKIQISNKFQNLLYLTRDAMKEVRKGNLKPLFMINKKYADEFILIYLKENKIGKAKKALNLKLSILEYEGEKMDIKNILKNIEEKIENLEPLNEDEFFVLAGQIIKYLLDKSKKEEKRADMIEPFLRAGKVKKLKEEIETLFFNYKHEILLNYRKFNNAFALVESFEGDRVKKDKLLVGILADNIFYQKSNQDEGGQQ